MYSNHIPTTTKKPTTLMTKRASTTDRAPSGTLQAASAPLAPEATEQTALRLGARAARDGTPTRAGSTKQAARTGARGAPGRRRC